MRKAFCGALLILATVSCASSDQKRVSGALAAEHYAAGEWGFAYLPPGVWVACPTKPDATGKPDGKTPIDGCRNATEDELEHACDVPGTREDCRAYAKAINALRKEGQLTNETQRLGALPGAARDRLKALQKCAERKGQCPEISQPASAKP